MTFVYGNCLTVGAAPSPTKADLTAVMVVGMHSAVGLEVKSEIYEDVLEIESKFVSYEVLQE